MKNYSYFLKEAGSALMDGAQSALDVILPRECIVCGRRLNIDEKYLCIYCEADLPLTHYWELRHNPMADKLNEMIQKKITAEVMANENAVKKEKATVMRTGGTMAETGADARPDTGRKHTETKSKTNCSEKADWPDAPLPLSVKYSYATALFFYHGGAGYCKIPQQLKYHAHICEGEFYARMLGKMIAGSPHFQDIDMIVPVPLHWARKWSRGYNQAEVIARAIAAEIKAEVRSDILTRIRHTRTQTKLGVTDKWRNVSGAFTLTAKATSGKAGYREDRGALNRKISDTERITRHVLVVDDVFTTGATICACINVLQPALGPGVRISAATIGYVSAG